MTMHVEQTRTTDRFSWAPIQILPIDPKNLTAPRIEIQGVGQVHQGVARAGEPEKPPGIYGGGNVYCFQMGANWIAAKSSNLCWRGRGSGRWQTSSRLVRRRPEIRECGDRIGIERRGAQQRKPLCPQMVLSLAGRLKAGPSIRQTARRLCCICRSRSSDGMLSSQLPTSEPIEGAHPAQPRY